MNPKPLCSVAVGVGVLMLTTAAPALAQSSPSGGTVYVYRYKQFVGMAVKPSVYCDNEEVARMQNGRYFALKLEPGEHALRSNDEQSGVNLQVKGGETYFVRVELATGFLKGHGRLVMTTPEQGRVEVLKLQPVDHDAIRDTRRASLDPFAMRPSEHKASSPDAAAARDKEAAPGRGASNAEKGRPLTNDDVVALAQGGLGDSIIVAKIRSSRAAFDVDPEALVALKKSGISDQVIAAMLDAPK